MINSRMIGGFILVTALAACSGKAPAKKEMPHLAKLRPANQYFRINPAEKNILRAEKGSQFTIEADSFVLPKQFNNQDRIEVLLIEATKSLEFAALPVSLEFRDKERDTLFESAGMFFVGAQYDGAPLKLMPGKKIKVKFRTDVSGDKFFVYNYDAQKGWQKHGHNQEVMLPPVLMAQAKRTRREKYDGDSEAAAEPMSEAPAGRRARKRPAAPAAPAVGAPSVRSFKAARVRSELYRVYEIDDLTWWNFDYPKPSLTCLKGTLSGSASEYASVTVFSKTELGAYTLYEPNAFRISFYRNTRARLFAIDSDGNIARTATFETPDTKGHHKRSDMPCFDLGTLKMQKVPDAIAGDAVKLRSYLTKDE
jgi:hypothetical protein